MAGLAGMPFAEDLADLIDTLSQMFGIGTGSIQKKVAELSEEMMPGAAPWVLRGILDNTTGATVSTRFGFGNILPLTSIGVAGASVEHEMVDFAGPVYASMYNTTKFAGALAKYGSQQVGLGNRTSSWSDVTKKSPAALVRNFGDVLTYHHTGKITDSMGRVVVENPTLVEMATKLVGFTPSRVTSEYDTVRAARRETTYARALRKNFTDAMVRAHIEGDRKEKREIYKMVREWNKNNRNTPLFIANFGDTVSRAIQGTAKTASQRFHDTAPVAAREHIRNLQQMYAGY